MKIGRQSMSANARNNTGRDARHEIMMSIAHPGDRKPHKPAEQQVVVQLLHQMPLGADREQDLQQARTDQPYRRDGGAAEIGIEPIELAIEARQGVIDDPPDRAQRMPGGDPLFEIDITEQRSARLVCTANACLRRGSAAGELYTAISVGARLFQQPVRPSARERPELNHLSTSLANPQSVK